MILTFHLNRDIGKILFQKWRKLFKNQKRISNLGEKSHNLSNESYDNMFVIVLVFPSFSFAWKGKISS